MQKTTVIMLVEDEPLAACQIRDALTERGYHVLPTVTSGEEAIRAAATLAPDLILMDVLLPGAMDGIEAARVIRARQQIPILFVTAVSDERSLHRAGLTAPLAYLLKPVEPSLLDTVIYIALLKGQREEKQLRIADVRGLASKPVKEPPENVTMCGWCRKMRQSADQWVTPGNHVTRRPAPSVSHGICPECSQKFFPTLHLPSASGKSPDRAV